MPYYEQVILPQMQQGKRILIAAHGNSLRALVMKLEGLSEEEIMGINIPTGVPLVYELDEAGAVTKKYYLGDEEAVKAAMAKVASQGKAEK